MPSDNVLAARQEIGTSRRHQPFESRFRESFSWAFEGNADISHLGLQSAIGREYESATNDRNLQRSSSIIVRYSCSSLSAVTLVGLCVQALRLCSRLPPRHSFRRPWFADFGGQNTEGSPYPFREAFSGSAIVSAAAHWQGLNAPFIVELFMRHTFHARARKFIISGWSASPQPDSRRQMR